MNKKLSALLEGSGVAPKTHPVLVSLLMMAAQSARIPAATAAQRQRLARAWHRVAAEFRRCVAAGISDKQLRAAMPFPGLSFTDEEGWKITATIPLEYRDLVAAALERTRLAEPVALKGFKIENMEDLRAAIKSNRLPEIEACAPGRVVSHLLSRRRLVVEREIFGRRLFSLLECDEFGRLRALVHRESKGLCMTYHSRNPLKS